MNIIIEKFRPIIIQIATPYATGTGFYLAEHQIIVTNEHVVRDNSEVVVQGDHQDRQLADVVYLDQKLDIAFLAPRTPWDVPTFLWHSEKEPAAGDKIIAVGHPFGLKFAATQGIISNTLHKIEEVLYIQHDAALNPGNSGGPLINEHGQIIGVNTFVVSNGENIGFSLPIAHVTAAVAAWELQEKAISACCTACRKIVTAQSVDKKYCPNCGARITTPNQIEPYQSAGVCKSIEEILEDAGYPVALSRRGPNHWEIQQGSARIMISYFEKSGLISGDAILCDLPADHLKPLYEYLLRQNSTLQGMTLCIHGQQVILSLLIYDQYLNKHIASKLFQQLFEKADYYDNQLVEVFGAKWRVVQ